MARPNSIIQGRDYECLDEIIDMHFGQPNPIILDCTFNTGKMWKKCKYSPSVTLDINEEFKPMVIGDFSALPFASESFDIVVYDPPHLPANAATMNSSKMWEKTYGITNDGVSRQGDNVNDIFEPFLKSVKSIIKPEGIILAKIADLVHNHKYQWQAVAFINACVANGLTPCDLLIKQDPAAGNLQSSKWKNIKHFRKCHCYWIIVRPNGKCERK